MTIRNERFRFLTLAIMLSVGAGLIWAVVFGCSFGIVSSIISSRDVHEALVFTRDGTPIIQSYVGSNYEARTYRTLDGKSVEIGRNDIEYRPQLLGPIDQRKRFFRPSWSKRIESLGNYWDDPESWYFICDDNFHCHGYVVGYDKLAKAKIGCIGRNGFRSNEPPREEQFPVDGRRISGQGSYAVTFNCFDGRGLYDTTCLLTDDGLVQINLKKRTVKVVRKEIDLISASMSYKPQTDAEKAPHDASSSRTILLRMPERVMVLDSSGKEIQTYLLPAELCNVAFVFIPLQGDKALVQKYVHQRNELLWIDTKGKIVDRSRVDLHEQWKLGNTLQSLAVSICVPCIGIIAGVFLSYPWGPAESQSLEYWAALCKGLHMYWPMLLITCVTCVVLAILCYRRQRKYGLPWTWAWTGFVLLFGVPAYLGYLAHRSWPVRLPCPHCGKPAPRDREACISCNRDFPAPTPKGIEVFA